eukprot:TRINITY_DN20548_c0_g1_i1.p1 TRINITY_DN20548_c0_g1~~TRINITY_DN20548_c0_g1_i1.p1  ORF type:complete len:884 (+),score=153.66 TRINITY_DN20548_c0_g1_i1:57-2708(+)
MVQSGLQCRGVPLKVPLLFLFFAGVVLCAFACTYVMMDNYMSTMNDMTGRYLQEVGLMLSDEVRVSLNELSHEPDRWVGRWNRYLHDFRMGTFEALRNARSNWWQVTLQESLLASSAYESVSICWKNGDSLALNNINTTHFQEVRTEDGFYSKRDIPWETMSNDAAPTEEQRHVCQSDPWYSSIERDFDNMVGEAVPKRRLTYVVYRHKLEAAAMLIATPLYEGTKCQEGGCIFTGVAAVVVSLNYVQEFLLNALNRAEYLTNLESSMNLDAVPTGTVSVSLIGSRKPMQRTPLTRGLQLERQLGGLTSYEGTVSFYVVDKAMGKAVASADPDRTDSSTLPVVLLGDEELQASTFSYDALTQKAQAIVDSAHTDPQAISSPEYRESKILMDKIAQAGSTKMTDINWSGVPYNVLSHRSHSGGKVYVHKLSLPLTTEGMGWEGYVLLDARHVRAGVERAVIILVACCLGILILWMCASALLLRMSLRPLRQLTSFMKTFAASGGTVLGPGGAFDFDGDHGSSAPSSETTVSQVFQELLGKSQRESVFAETHTLHDAALQLSQSVRSCMDHIQDTAIAIAQLRDANPLSTSIEPRYTRSRVQSDGELRPRHISALSVKLDLHHLAPADSQVSIASEEYLADLSKVCQACRRHYGQVHHFDESGLVVLFLMHDHRSRAVTCVGSLLSLFTSDKRDGGLFSSSVVIGGVTGKATVGNIGSSSLKHCMSAGPLMSQARITRELCTSRRSRALITERLAKAMVGSEVALNTFSHYLRIVDLIWFEESSAPTQLVDVSATPGGGQRMGNEAAFDTAHADDCLSLWRNYCALWEELAKGSSVDTALTCIGIDTHPAATALAERLRSTESARQCEKLSSLPYRISEAGLRML